MFRAIATDKFLPFRTFYLRTPPVENRSPNLAEVHLFTGVNGTGKTRLLSLLAAVLGNPEPLKKRIGEEKIFIYGTEMEAYPEAPSSWKTTYRATRNSVDLTQAGSLHRWAATVPAFAYSGGAYVTDTQITVMGEVARPERESCLSFLRPPEHSKALLQGIANLKVQAAMDALNAEEGPVLSRTLNVVKSIERAISEITAKSFSFHVSSHPKASVGVIWGGVKLPFDLLPDGLRSIIGWLAHAVVMLDAWLQGKDDPLKCESVFLLDEIESLLHPAWQRRVLPAFQRLFPNAQIFIATHSPFVIASLNEGWIHSLTVNKDGGVLIQQPIPASKGDSYISVVEGIMGVEEWFDPETEKLLEDFRRKRDEAFHGNTESLLSAQQLAKEIGSRSMELDYMMGRELSQMNRKLGKR